MISRSRGSGKRRQRGRAARRLARTIQQPSRLDQGDRTGARRRRILRQGEPRRQQQRQGCANADLQGQAIDTQARMSDSASALLQKAAAKLGWSGRSVHRSLKVARTIADLAGSDTIASVHVAEALQYRRVLQGQ